MGKRKHSDSELMGLESLSSSDDDKEKKGFFRRIFGVPVVLVKTPIVVVTRLLRGIVNALLEIVKLPARVLGGLARPWRSKKKGEKDGEKGEGAAADDE